MASAKQKNTQSERDNDDEKDNDSGLVDFNATDVKKVLKRAQKRGFITHDEINALLPNDEMTSDQIEDVMSQISEMGIAVVETEEEAQSLVEELNGGADFAELAKEHSTGPSGPNGGELGWFGPGMMVEPFEKAVEQLEAGEISEPVETQFGWHVVKLNETRSKSAPALDEVRDEIEQTLQQEAVKNYIDEKVAAADVTRKDSADVDTSVLSQVELLEE